MPKERPASAGGPSGRISPSRIGLGLAIAFLLGSAALLYARLPGLVPLYYAPASEPDVELPRAIYLVQWAAMVGMVAVLFGYIVTITADLLTSDRRKRPTDLPRSTGEWCAAWIVACLTAVLLIDLVSLDGSIGWMLLRLVGVLLAFAGIPVVAWAATRKGRRVVTKRRKRR